MNRSSGSSQFSALRKDERLRWGGADEEYLPEEEIWVGHEVGDALEHASRLEHECWKGDFVEIHADSNREWGIGSAHSATLGESTEG